MMLSIQANNDSYRVICSDVFYGYRQDKGWRGTNAMEYVCRAAPTPERGQERENASQNLPTLIAGGGMFPLAR